MSQSQKGMTYITEWSHHRSQHVTDNHMMGNIRTMRGEVHSHNSSCIYSIENQMGTLLSSPCQL